MRNFRPVSVLSVVSKVFERVVCDQTETYLGEKKLLLSFDLVFQHI